jgi:glycosyltransferase involved in cell wall biosynthesis
MFISSFNKVSNMLPKGSLYGGAIYALLEKAAIFKWFNVGINKHQEKPVLYFGKTIPASSGYVNGGAVKLQRLQNFFEADKSRCNILYLVSSKSPLGAGSLIKTAKSRGIRFVWNQNGVSFPASMPEKWDKINKKMAELLHQSQYVVYQSYFCKRSADTFLGKYNGKSEIIYNCVDTKLFKPDLEKINSKPFTILLAGNIYRKSKFDLAAKVFYELKKNIKDAQMIIAGNIHWLGSNKKECMAHVHETLHKFNIRNDTLLFGAYSQKQAPAIYNSADVLIHPKNMDPSPGLVVEAMSCGVPVVFSKSGGTPELVGEKAGIGIETQENWEKTYLPDPDLLAKAVLQIAENKEEYSKAARERAVKLFSIDLFVDKHRNIFNKLLNRF